MNVLDRESTINCVYVCGAPGVCVVMHLGYCSVCAHCTTLRLFLLHIHFYIRVVSRSD